MTASLQVQDPATGAWRDLQGVTDVRVNLAHPPRARHAAPADPALEALAAHAPRPLSAWERTKLRWALDVGLVLARWVVRYGSNR